MSELKDKYTPEELYVIMSGMEHDSESTITESVAGNKELYDERFITSAGRSVDEMGYIELEYALVDIRKRRCESHNLGDQLLTQKLNNEINIINRRIREIRPMFIVNKWKAIRERNNGEYPVSQKLFSSPEPNHRRGEQDFEFELHKQASKHFDSWLLESEYFMKMAVDLGYLQRDVEPVMQMDVHVKPNIFKSIKSLIYSTISKLYGLIRTTIDFTVRKKK